MSSNKNPWCHTSCMMFNLELLNIFWNSKLQACQHGAIAPGRGCCCQLPANNHQFWQSLLLSHNSSWCPHKTIPFQTIPQLIDKHNIILVCHHVSHRDCAFGRRGCVTSPRGPRSILEGQQTKAINHQPEFLSVFSRCAEHDCTGSQNQF